LKTFRAYRIDPATRTVSEIAFKDHMTARQEVGTDDLDHAVMRRVDDGLICLFVDGAGYYKPELKWWRFAGYENPLCGVGVIFGSDPMGETDDVPVSLAEMTSLVSWIDGRPRLPSASAGPLDGEPIVVIDFNAPDAPTTQAETFRRLFGEDPPKRKP